MKKLKKVLFKRALMYRKAMNSSTDVEEVGTYAAAYLAVHEIIAEAGLDEEFQQYKIKHGGAEDE